MSIDKDAGTRVYRHRPWLILAALVVVFVGGCTVAVVAYAARTASIEGVAKAILFLVPLMAFEAFLVLSFRVRTVVTDTGVTQQWISCSYHIPYTEITDLEPVQTPLRWYLRLHCGDRTFEVIPCNTYLWQPLSAAIGPPRAMRAAQADIQDRASHHAPRA